MEVLIDGSAECIRAQQAFFFLEKAAGFDIHFCSWTQNEDSTYNTSWCDMDVRDDLLRILRTYQRMPFTSIEATLKKVKELEFANSSKAGQDEALKQLRDEQNALKLKMQEKMEFAILKQTFTKMKQETEQARIEVRADKVKLEKKDEQIESDTKIFEMIRESVNKSNDPTVIKGIINGLLQQRKTVGM